MRFLALFVAAAALVSGSASSANAQNWFYERCEPFSKEVALEIERGLTAAERSILRGTRIKCVEDFGFGAAASRASDGTPTITVASGTIAALEIVSTANALGAAYGENFCGGAFLESYASAAAANVKRHFQGQPLKAGVDPFTFARQNPDVCPRVTLSEFKANAEADNLREMMINGGLRFILAHELAHIVFDHIDDLEVSPSVSRRREQACDEFALRVVTKAGQTPLEAMIAVALLAAFDDYSARTASATHPAGPERFAAVARAGVALLQNDPEFEKWLKADPQRAARWTQGIEALKAMGIVE